MNGKTPISGNNWTMMDLPNYGFKPFEYYDFETNFGRWWYEKFGDRFFTVKKELKTSTFRMEYDEYFIYCDEWGYVEVFHRVDKKTEQHRLLYSERRGVTLADLFDTIKHHKRERSLKSLENELV